MRTGRRSWREDMRDWIEEFIATGIMGNSPMGNRDDRIDANLHINREISIKS